MTTIIQADRSAAARYWGNDNPPQELQREMALHREQAAAEERAKIVAWLRENSNLIDITGAYQSSTPSKLGSI